MDTGSKVTNAITGSAPSQRVGANSEVKVGVGNQDKDDKTIELSIPPKQKSMPNPKIGVGNFGRGQKKDASTVVNSATPLMRAARLKRLNMNNSGV